MFLLIPIQISKIFCSAGHWWYCSFAKKIAIMDMPCFSSLPCDMPVARDEQIYNIYILYFFSTQLFFHTVYCDVLMKEYTVKHHISWEISNYHV